jgi:phage protein D
MLNDPYGSQTAIRSPRLRVLSNGAELAGSISASVTNNNYHQCDTFRVSFAMSVGAPGWWDVNPPLVLDIQVSIDGAQSWQSLLIGEVDHQNVHLQTGTIEMEGRDLSARLIEAKTQEAFANQTASDIAKTLAARHGMTTNITATTTLAGRYYEQDHSTVTLGEFSRTTTEWDLLVYLAQREGFDVFMSGTTLNFVPSVAQNANPYVIQWSPPSPMVRLNAVGLTMERSLALAKDVQVEVRSWSSRQGRAFTKTASAIGGKSSGASGATGKATTTQKYVIVRPNLTEDAAQQLANQTAAQITLHERVASVDMPGELQLTPRNMAKIQGTNTSFDQAYFIASIERHISFGEGFHQSMRLKNSSPRTQTQV